MGGGKKTDNKDPKNYGKAWSDKGYRNDRWADPNDPDKTYEEDPNWVWRGAFGTTRSRPSLFNRHMR